MKKRTRYLIFVLCLIFGLVFLIPTVKWYGIYSEQDKDEARLHGDKLKLEVADRVADLREKLEQDESAYEKELKVLNKEFKKEIQIFNKANPGSKIATNKMFSYAEMKKTLLDIKGKEKQVDAFFNLILEDYYKTIFDEKKKVKESIIKLGLDLQGGAYAVVKVIFDDPKLKEQYPNGVPTEEKSAMFDSAILKIENRIDKYGVAETSIQKLKEQEKIVINLPGVKEATELRQIIETVGVLEFKYVSDKGTEALYKIIEEAKNENKRFLGPDGKLTPEYLQKLQAEVPDVIALPQSDKDRWGVEKIKRNMIAVEKESLLRKKDADGKVKDIKITSASVDQNNMGQNVVNFVLADEDAKEWARITEEAAKDQRRIAIILDDVVLQDPVVREKIPNGRSQITLGNSPIEELRTLALVLRSGSLDVPLEISEEHTVGASLGRDTIEKGLYAILFGFIFVLVFMIFWYNVGGIIADIAMILNLLLLVGGLALFRGTLTLPGIAGIILTVGMAVDANVIIFERIKEEFRSGKTFKTALHLGYDKAFWTIMDANITTFLAGIGLTLFGTGPIKGFAVTLCLGIVMSLFTSLFVSRLLFDSLLGIFEFKSLRVLSLVRGK